MKSSDVAMSALGDMLREERERKHICGLSTVQPVGNIMLNDKAHAGTVVHVCSRPAHQDTVCRCACEYQWTKNVK